MIPHEKYVEIAKGLLEKTKQRKVAWKQLTAQELADTRYTVEREGQIRRYEHTGFVFSLPNSTVRLTFSSPAAGNDFVSLMILDKNGRLAGSWDAEEGEDDWPPAYELYLEVSKQVTKWDKVLEEVEAFIGKP